MSLERAHGEDIVKYLDCVVVREATHVIKLHRPVHTHVNV